MGEKIYPKITITMTAGRRYPLFRRTVKSFTENCRDDDLIVRWIVSDDGSAQDSFRLMQRQYPFIEVYRSPKAGQPASLNWLWGLVETEWFFHMEDDWMFFKAGHFIRQLFDIAFDDETLKNVVLTHWEPLRPDLLRKTKRWGVEYVVHEYNLGVPPETKEATNCDWYGWSLNPGLQNTAVVRELGKFDESQSVTSRWWDRPLAKRYMDLGYQRASLYEEYIRHAGADSLYAVLRRECRDKKGGCTEWPKCENCQLT